MKRTRFASLIVLKVFSRWGKVGLLFYLAYKGIRNIWGKKSELFTAGWQEPVAPKIVEKACGREFRVIIKDVAYPFNSLKISDKTGGKVNEDIYPLV